MTQGDATTTKEFFSKHREVITERPNQINNVSIDSNSIG
jgi:hypothetical protein